MPTRSPRPSPGPPTVTGSCASAGWPTTSETPLLAGASVFAYPSRYEGFGLPPLQAAAHRCPVVATTVGALPEVLDDAAQWAAPHDSDALASALGTVLASPERSQDLVTRGLVRLRRYSWDATADAMVTLYGDATGL